MNRDLGRKLKRNLGYLDPAAWLETLQWSSAKLEVTLGSTVGQRKTLDCGGFLEYALLCWRSSYKIPCATFSTTAL